MSEIGHRPRAVFDCNVTLQSLFSETGTAAQLLRLVEQHRIELFLSRSILREFREVLEYPKLRARNAHLTPSRITAFIKRLMFHGTLMTDVPHVFDYPRARQDEPYIDLAVAADARYLISRDTDLLTLMTGHSAECKRFRRQFHRLKIMTPEEFLLQIEQGT